MQKKEISYVKEMLLSSGNVYAMLATAAASVLISIPYGFKAALLPIIVFAAGDAIAALFIPYSEQFRAKVDKQYRDQDRESSRQRLLDEIGRRQGNNANYFGSFDSYHRMLQHVTSLYKIAFDNQTRLAIPDVEKLDDATLDYLSMWLALMVIEERTNAISLDEIEMRLQSVDEDLADLKPGADHMQLQKARNEYLSLITRHRRMLSRKTAIEAALLAMPDQMDEIYQTIMSSPMSSDVDSALADSIAKLGLEEDLEAELEGALRDSVPAISQQMSSRYEHRQEQRQSAASGQQRNKQTQRQSR